MSDNEILRMKGIIKDYVLGSGTSRVLKGIDLTVDRGEFLAILGPSGSGKSTLMNIIGCLDVPTEGEYYLSGKKIADQDEASLAQIRNKEVGFIFQQFQLLQRQTAFENVELPLIYANMPEKQRRERVREMLEKVQLGDKMEYFPNQLSGGQQQRVSIGRALMNNPALLLADEPTGNLDSENSKEIVALLRKFNKENNQTVIIITHDERIALSADRIITIEDGRITKDSGRVEVSAV